MISMYLILQFLFIDYLGLFSREGTWDSGREG